MSHDVFSVLCDPDTCTCVSSFIHYSEFGSLSVQDLIVSLVFSHLGFWSGNLFLIAPFPDLCLLVPF